MKVYIESINGHDELEVPKQEVPNLVGEALQNDKWVTVDFGTGETPKILTELPNPEAKEETKTEEPVVEQPPVEPTEEKKEEKPKPDWSNVFSKSSNFKNIDQAKSLTVTGKSKGG